MKDFYTNSFSVEGGNIIGCQTEDKAVNIFKGIPYAAPPVKSLRWKAPQPVQKWEGIKKCVSWEKAAFQPKQEAFFCWSQEFILDDTLGYSEDCLYLNVWSANDEIKNKPVIVYLHGGNLETGGSSCEVYDGEQLARAGIIFVSVDFRVGILGLLSASVLSAENERKISGNYMLLDQIAALKWVKNNISAFGGNPDNVTLMGQSSGGGSVNVLAVSPLAKGLFKNAVALGHSTFTFPMRNCPPETGKRIFEHGYIFQTLSEAEAIGDEFFKGMTAEQMREIPPEKLLEYPAHKVPYCIDNYVLTETFHDGVIDGLTNDINYITGFVDSDNMLFSFIEPNSKEEYISDVKKFFGENSDEALKVYPPAEDFTFANNGEKLDKVKTIVNDFLSADSISLAKARKKAGNSNTWLLVFEHVMPGPEAFIWGAFHTSEIPYFLKHFSNLRKDLWTEDDYKVGDVIFNRLVNFAKTGNPNSSDMPEWKDGIVYRLDAGVFEPKKFTPEKINLWSKKYNW